MTAMVSTPPTEIIPPPPVMAEPIKINSVKTITNPIMLLFLQNSDEGYWMLDLAFSNEMGIPLQRLIEVAEAVDTLDPSKIPTAARNSFATLLALEYLAIALENPAVDNINTISTVETQALTDGKMNKPVTKQTLNKKRAQKMKKILQIQIETGKIAANWKEIAENYIIKHQGRISPTWVAAANELLESKQSLIQEKVVCEKCGEARLKFIKMCPNCLVSADLRLSQCNQEEYTLDLAHKKGRPNLDNIDWSTVKGCRWLPGGLGSFGTIAAEFSDGLVILKCSDKFLQEFLAYRIAYFLGVPVPEMRMITRVTEEGQTVLKSLLEAPFTNSNDGMRIIKWNIFPKIFVMGFIPSDFCIAIPQPAAHILNNFNFLSQLARVLAFDVFINNFDRIPMIWMNDGNPDNLLIKLIDGTKSLVTSIDQMVVPICDSFLDRYKTITERLIELLFQVSTTKRLPEDNDIVTRLQQFFELHSGKIEHDSLVYLLSEILEALKQFSAVLMDKIGTIETEIREDPQFDTHLGNFDNLLTFVKDITDWVSTCIVKYSNKI